MKSKLVTLFAVALFAVAAPVLAEDGRHVAGHDEQCARDCSMLLKNCAQQVDTIQDRIKKLQKLVDEKGSTTYTRDELKALNKKLAEANETLRVLSKP